MRKDELMFCRYFIIEDKKNLFPGSCLKLLFASIPKSLLLNSITMQNHTPTVFSSWDLQLDYKKNTCG